MLQIDLSSSTMLAPMNVLDFVALKLKARVCVPMLVHGSHTNTRGIRGGGGGGDGDNALMQAQVCGGSGRHSGEGGVRVGRGTMHGRWFGQGPQSSQ